MRIPSRTLTAFPSGVRALAGSAWLLFAACTTVGPDYVPPQTTMPTDFHTRVEKQKFESKKEQDNNKEEKETEKTPEIPVKQVTPEMLAEWWQTLEDPLLSQLVDKAVNDNLDLKLAQSRVREERARRGIARSERFPTIDAVGSTARQRSSRENLFRRGGEFNMYSAGFDSTWEIDLFGRIQRSVEAAEASVEARKEQLNDTLVTLVAEVALNYIEIRTFQARLEAAEKNRRVQEETLQIVKDRLQAGLTSTLTLEQAKYNLENTKAEIPTLKTGVEQGKNGLSVLLGEFPGAINEELQEFKQVPVTPMDVVVGVPADLLRRRPDIRQAERELAAQTARIGIATSELYPRFTLLGSIGLESISASSFLSGPATAFSIGPQVTWNVFSAGRIRQNIKVQDELQEQALIQYEATVLTAVQDVENALIDYAKEQVRRQALLKSIESAQNAVELSRELYVAGLSDFIAVLEAERSLFSFQDQLAVSEGRVVSNLIRLFKALGGGWKPLMAEAPEEQPQS
ncbi:RND efflux system, outer membrane lipoprotein, NodT family protein [Nitrospina gracilis 3/211]|uniref:RND efflux system, outer membrane lipoprotein, NodT family protein n=1 Tax=Nitrospina gracilis (strain 3/211) TaxID=1266370 RepID=M1Z8U2_NITG3|nr:MULTISPECIES: TolC family protein [Nitrospina]MCF8722293.1 NodT family efflux transporter outer membrane factor (OMF) lipoprotein [Nitrospina sp. Nb-3]CCQ89498.1 RND efflux system, outer membrane lipoprotein, NodT family protein [Nitrospina gracilis 3/211]